MVKRNNKKSTGFTEPMSDRAISGNLPLNHNGPAVLEYLMPTELGISTGKAVKQSRDQFDE